MATYSVGQTAYSVLRVYSSGTTLADLGGGDATCTVTKPDGTTTSASVTKTATGIYQAQLTTTQAGRHARQRVPRGAPRSFHEVPPFDAHRPAGPSGGPLTVLLFFGLAQ